MSVKILDVCRIRPEIVDAFLVGGEENESDLESTRRSKSPPKVNHF